MTAPYTGAWSRLTGAAPVIPFQQPVHPEHLNPTAPDPNAPGLAKVWQSDVRAPLLPDGYYEPDTYGLVAPGGVVDQTPQDHQFGLGADPGLTQLDSQDRRLDAHDTDTGEEAARQYEVAPDRDGTFHVMVWNNHPTPDSVDSPETVALQRTGVGMPNDPEARTSRKYRRWTDRFIDRHAFDPNRRPRQARGAETAALQPADPTGNQYVSPYPNSVGYHAQTQDQLIFPQVRRVPGGWVQPLVTDGTESLAPAGANLFGLTNTGL
jgi:hypothetical protein